MDKPLKSAIISTLQVAHGIFSDRRGDCCVLQSAQEMAERDYYWAIDFAQILYQELRRLVS